MGTTRRILIAAGGTGGHIFPGIALGRTINVLYPQWEVRYLCGERPLEQKLYDGEGIKPILLPAAPLTGGVIAKGKALWRLIKNVQRSKSIIRQHGIDTVVGMGGYVSGPAILAARLSGCKTLLHEANAIPGKANRWMAPYVDVLAGHFPESVKVSKARRTEVVGMPIRFKRDTVPSRAELLESFGLLADRRALLIVGGSQGAQRLYKTLLAALRKVDILHFHDLQILWSTGPNNFREFDAAIAESPFQFLHVKVVPFIDRMDLALMACDAALTRAGASTIAELLSAEIFPCFVPFPYAIYDHQTLNAEVVTKAGIGWLYPEKELTPDSAAEMLRRLFERIKSVPPGARIPVPTALDSRRAGERLARIIDELDATH